MAFLRGSTDVLNRPATEIHAHGLSVRDIEDALQDATGKPLLSRTAVSELSETLWEDYQCFCERDPSAFAVEYVFVDAVYEGLRQWGQASLPWVYKLHFGLIKALKRFYWMHLKWGNTRCARAFRALWLHAS
jgi:hypothetical protein